MDSGETGHNNNSINNTINRTYGQRTYYNNLEVVFINESSFLYRYHHHNLSSKNIILLCHPAVLLVVITMIMMMTRMTYRRMHNLSKVLFVYIMKNRCPLFCRRHHQLNSFQMIMTMTINLITTVVFISHFN